MNRCTRPIPLRLSINGRAELTSVDVGPISRLLEVGTIPPPEHKLHLTSLGIRDFLAVTIWGEPCV